MEITKTDLALLEKFLDKEEVESHLLYYYRSLSNGKPEEYVCAKEQIERDIRRLRYGTF